MYLASKWVLLGGLNFVFCWIFTAMSLGMMKDSFCKILDAAHHFLHVRGFLSFEIGDWWFFFSFFFWNIRLLSRKFFFLILSSSSGFILKIILRFLLQHHVKVGRQEGRLRHEHPRSGIFGGGFNGRPFRISNLWVCGYHLEMYQVQFWTFWYKQPEPPPNNYKDL